MLGLYMYATDEAEESDLSLMIMLHLSIPTVFLVATLTAAHYDPRFIELAGPSITVPTTVLLYLTYLTDIFEMDREMREQ